VPPPNRHKPAAPCDNDAPRCVQFTRRGGGSARQLSHMPHSIPASRRAWRVMAAARTLTRCPADTVALATRTRPPASGRRAGKTAFGSQTTYGRRSVGHACIRAQDRPQMRPRWYIALFQIPRSERLGRLSGMPLVMWSPEFELDGLGAHTVRSPGREPARAAWLDHGAVPTHLRRVTLTIPYRSDPAHLVNEAGLLTSRVGHFAPTLSLWIKIDREFPSRWSTSDHIRS
jgi:hypothetical protein